jgi:3-phosphoshikimate 1-carboxyvinyltransferase
VGFDPASERSTDVSAARAVDVVTEPFTAAVLLPGSKSIANRAIACAAMATGRSRLTHVPDGDDTVAMVAGLRALGVPIEADGPAVFVTGRGGHLADGPADVDARLAGTTSRFVTALAALGPGPVRVDGAPPLRTRPMGPLHDALTALGARITPVGEPGRLPVIVAGGALRGGHLVLRGDVSSQFVTALMLIAPCLPGGLEIEVSSPLVSRPYVELTAAVLAAFGVPDVDLGSARIVVPEATYWANDLTIEPDASSATYIAAAAALGRAGSRVHLRGLGPDSVQPDARFFALLAAMGARVERHDDGTWVEGTGRLRGIDADLSGCSDAVPTLAVLAATGEGPTRVRGVGFIRAKESDRIGALATELRRCGAVVDEHDDGLTVHPAVLRGGRVQTYDDHRLAMAFAVLGRRVPGITIEDPDVVAKSFPGFWEVIDQLRQR